MPAALAALLPLIVQYGIPAVQQLVKMFTQANGPTDADWNTLKALTQTTARQQMLATLQAHNIDPASPQGVALLALTPS